MTIYIENEEMTDKRATKFLSKPDDLVRQIVRAWTQSNIAHDFNSKQSFKKALRKNRETLESPETIETLFTSRNYLFSTKAKDRTESLYFKDRTTKETGRLRQQHRTGPLATIDKKPKRHRFVSKTRHKFLKEWRKKRPSQLPRFYSYEQGAKVGKHHIEFAFEREKVSGWHPSGGTVDTNREYLDRRIASALEDILGIRSKTTPREKIVIDRSRGRVTFQP
jgi:hypothetical protein